MISSYAISCTISGYEMRFWLFATYHIIGKLWNHTPKTMKLPMTWVFNCLSGVMTCTARFFMNSYGLSYLIWVWTMISNNQCHDSNALLRSIWFHSFVISWYMDICMISYMIKVYHTWYYCNFLQIVAARINCSVSQDLTMMQILQSFQPLHLTLWGQRWQPRRDSSLCCVCCSWHIRQKAVSLRWLCQAKDAGGQWRTWNGLQWKHRTRRWQDKKGRVLPSLLLQPSPHWSRDWPGPGS